MVSDTENPCPDMQHWIFLSKMKKFNVTAEGLMDRQSTRNRIRSDD
eukprot:CAMPEP_0116888194 /NCGR_PEP_ID=MMETSP0463-20121206/23054_1 /TAXON_ID=181622 /ORGANISM="Strombidinopsis sp, Strain SopsisLIS2011" /LENGTH=45 /DNA_ID= /DNA_START= /DNA_END= /DNA_ORIENTATION=